MTLNSVQKLYIDFGKEKFTLDVSNNRHLKMLNILGLYT